MEEKKKVRPTWTMVKNLEKKLAEAEETVHRQCVELDAWREKFRRLETEYQKRLEDIDAQLQKMKDRVIECNKITEAAKAEVKRLRSRGWLARLLNK